MLSCRRRRRPRESEGLTLRDALERALEPEILAAIRPLDDVLDPGSYLGETDAIVTAALAGWARRSVGLAARRLKELDRDPVRIPEIEPNPPGLMPVSTSTGGRPNDVTPFSTARA